MCSTRPLPLALLRRHWRAEHCGHLSQAAGANDTLLLAPSPPSRPAMQSDPKLPSSPPCRSTSKKHCPANVRARPSSDNRRLLLQSRSASRTPRAQYACSIHLPLFKGWLVLVRDMALARSPEEVPAWRPGLVHAVIQNHQLESPACTYAGCMKPTTHAGSLNPRLDGRGRRLAGDACGKPIR